MRPNYAIPKPINLTWAKDYPRKRLGEIEQIIHSSKYKARLAEYNKNKTLAEKNLEQKNYASAKVYFQKALTLSPADKRASGNGSPKQTD